MLFFSLTSLFIDELADLGVDSIGYFCSGGLLLSTTYFIYKREWSRRNIPDQSKNTDKVLLLTYDNKFDWLSFLIIILGGLAYIAIFLLVSFTFNLAHRANLNIGISQSIWQVEPFFISAMEAILYGTVFDKRMIWGMLALVLCAIIICLSDDVSENT